jgi:hypothetical protein
MNEKLFLLLAVAAVFSLLLASLVIALIVSAKFRDAILGGPGEATILGLLTVKGALPILF